MQYSSGIAVFVENIGLGVFGQAVAAVPNAAANLDVAVSRFMVCVGQQEVAAMFTLPAQENSRSRLGVQLGVRTNAQRGCDAVQAGGNVQRAGAAVQSGLKGGGVVGDSVAHSAPVFDILK